MKHYSLRSYLTRNLVGWAFVMTVLPAIAVYYDARHEVDELFDASLVQTTKVLNGILTRKAVEENPQHVIDSLLAKDVDLVVGENHHHYEKKISFQIWDDNGLVVKSKSAPDIAFAHFEEGFHRIEASGYEWTSFALYSEFDQWWVVVGERTDVRGELIRDITFSHVLPILVFIPLLLIVVSWILQRGFDPLNKLILAVSQREYKSLHPIEDQTAPLEVAALISVLNDLLARLQIAYNRESEFVSDVAHELRTPLAGILIQTENVIDELHDNPAISKLISTKQAVNRLTHLVNQLLSTSRSSQELTSQKIQLIDLKDLCERAVIEQRHRAEAKELLITVKLDQCIVEGNESNLASLIGNLLDNAIKYTPEQGEVRLSLSSKGNQHCLTIEDSGDGIPNELHETVKQRFYRANTQRAEGSGLGLAIVDNVVTQMQCQWKMSQSDLGGLKQEIRFDEKPTVNI